MRVRVRTGFGAMDDTFREDFGEAHCRSARFPMVFRGEPLRTVVFDEWAR